MSDNQRKVALEFGFVGLGGAGGKIVEAFRFNGGYKTVAANISSQDLAKLKLSSEKDSKVHMDLGLDGAGKNMEIGASAIKKFSGELHQTIASQFVKDQHIIVCAGGGGGTGSGGIVELLKLCKEHTNNVGCLFTIPKETEGEKVRHNTYQTLAELYKLAENKIISPLILVDNEKIAEMHKDWDIIRFWKLANSEVTSLFHQINLVCAQDSEIHPFDPADYRTVIQSGRCLVFGSLDIPTDSLIQTSIATYMRENLQAGLLAKGFDDHYSESKIAGAILMGKEDVLSGIPMEYLDMAFGILNRMIGDGTVHRGIYTNEKIPLRVYSMIGNLPLPQDRIKLLSRGL